MKNFKTKLNMLGKEIDWNYQREILIFIPSHDATDQNPEQNLIWMFEAEFQGLDEKQVLSGFRSITLHDHI